MDKDYREFLNNKGITAGARGIEIDPSRIHAKLFPFQRDLVMWASRKGRSAIFADTGLGKTFMQLEWARLIGKQTLIIAPLTVAGQTVGEGAKLGTGVHYTRSKDDIVQGINITNYEMIEAFDPDAFDSVVLDESSILKGLTGKTRAKLTAMFADTPYKLCCTATPAPNDITEIANHAEFLGIMRRVEMLATFFVHDDKGWRLKKHAVQLFFRWLASWGMSIRMPSDLGYDDDGFILPELTTSVHFVRTDYRPEGQLFFTGLKGITDRSLVRRETLQERTEAAIEMIGSNDEQWVVWCGLNAEQDTIAKALGDDCVSVYGGLKLDEKIRRIEAWQAGRARVLVTKPRVCGFGMNFQNCHNMVFVGLSDSWESYYQCTRRCWRFGQESPVTVHIILSEIEDAIYQNIMNKEGEAKRMTSNLIENVQEYERKEIGAIAEQDTSYETGDAFGKGWALMLGDSAERIGELEADSIDLSVFSPPFASLYTYSASERDLGNSRSDAEFMAHFRFIIGELLRVTRPGRICAVHVADIPAMMVRDGYIGMKDFSGDVIRAFIDSGWIFDARIPIDKNQQAQSIRTHTKALTMTQLKKDRSWLRPALPDYILKFRKAGDNVEVVVNGDITRDLWIEWANPTWPSDTDRCSEWGAWATWYGIRESDTLQGWRHARGEKDERHICPLQLGTIERCIRLWSNEGNVVLDPFAGIGSVGTEALRLHREFVGIELKRSYFETASNNLKDAENAAYEPDLFTYADMAAGPGSPPRR